jgi:cytochrome P450
MSVQRAADLDLPFLDMGEDWFAANPYPEFARARAAHPWLARWPIGYVITDYKAIRDLFNQEAKMAMLYNDIVRLMEAEGTPWGNFQQRHLLSMSGERHKHVRDVLAPSFTPRAANRHRDLMRATVSELLDEWVPKGAFDFERFASLFPVTVMTRLIGASPEVIPGLRSAMEAIGRSANMDKRWLPAMQEGVVTMEKFVADLIAERRANPRTGEEPDLLDLLLETRERGELTECEFEDLLIFLFVAGSDTSKNMLGLTMVELLENPEVYRRCGEDYDYARLVVEESFRCHSTVSSQRVLTDDVVYRDTILEKGAIVWFPLSVSLHDPRYADDPDRFDPERERKHPHIGFGLGPHICLGQYIARFQIHEGMHQICRRIPHPRSPGPTGWRTFPGAWGVEGLPIEFDVEAA